MIIKHNHALCTATEHYTISIVAEGNAFCDTNWHATVVSPPYTRLYYIIDGSGEIETAQGTLQLTAGNLYMLTMGHSFSYRCDSWMQQLYFHINLTDTCGADILRGIDKILSKKISASHIQKLLALFHEENMIGRGYLKALLQADVFSLLLDNQIDIKNKRLSDPIQKALIYIENNLSASLTVKTISDEISVSPTTLSHKFKAEMDISIGKYIDGMIMSRAEDLLINSTLSLSSISDKLGFYDQFYFSRRFKEKHDISPLRYRKVHRLSE